MVRFRQIGKGDPVLSGGGDILLDRQVVVRYTQSIARTPDRHAEMARSTQLLDGVDAACIE
jgi:hypothetical protein